MIARIPPQPTGLPENVARDGTLNTPAGAVQGRNSFGKIGYNGPSPPPGHGVQTKSHNAVAAAVRQGRADWGVAIDTVARQYGLGFIALQEEHYDFVVPTARLERPAVRAFGDLLADATMRAQLRQLGFRL